MRIFAWLAALAVVLFVVLCFLPAPRKPGPRPTPVLRMSKPVRLDSPAPAPSPAPCSNPAPAAPSVSSSTLASSSSFSSSSSPSPPSRIEPPGPSGYPRPPRDVFEAQVALARLAIASGSIDGLFGPQTRAALAAFQKRELLPATGDLDAPTRARLLLAAPPLRTRLVTSNDLQRLQPLSPDWLGKSHQTALEYESVLELVAEESHASPRLVRRLNPGVAWTNLAADAALQVPDASYPSPDAKAAFLRISLSQKILEAFDASSNLVAHFPCSIARNVEKRPVGELHVAAIAPNPNYTFDPDLFPESAEARQIKTKLIIPPGPNNPVGVAWIGLDRPGYGIHGTPAPEQIGRTESHGCFRLANWNAAYLLSLVAIGMPVFVEP